jgi:hypothetical protein
MTVIYSEHSGHRANLINAERTLQAFLGAASLTQAQANTAYIAFYRSALSSAIANNCNPGEFVEALKALGVNS